MAAPQPMVKLHGVSDRGISTYNGILCDKRRDAIVCEAFALHRSEDVEDEG